MGLLIFTHKNYTRSEATQRFGVAAHTLHLTTLGWSDTACALLEQGMAVVLPLDFFTATGWAAPASTVVLFDAEVLDALQSEYSYLIPLMLQARARHRRATLISEAAAGEAA